MSVSVVVKVTADQVGPIREWMREHGRPGSSRLPREALLAEYVACQLISNSDWEGVELAVEAVS